MENGDIAGLSLAGRKIVRKFDRLWAHESPLVVFMKPYAELGVEPGLTISKASALLAVYTISLALLHFSFFEHLLPPLTPSLPSTPVSTLEFILFKLFHCLMTFRNFYIINKTQTLKQKSMVLTKNFKSCFQDSFYLSSFWERGPYLVVLRDYF